MSIHVVGFVGSSGSGKTTLIERLLPHLARKGLRVGVMNARTLGPDGRSADPLGEPDFLAMLGKFDPECVDCCETS